MSIGQIIQVIGAVVDIEFARDEMPKVYEALVLEKDETNKLAEEGLTFEVQQQLGDGVVRTIAMGSSDGLRRGMKVKATGAGIDTTRCTVYYSLNLFYIVFAFFIKHNTCGAL